MEEFNPAILGAHVQKDRITMLPNMEEIELEYSSSMTAYIIEMDDKGEDIEGFNMPKPLIINIIY